MPLDEVALLENLDALASWLREPRVQEPIARPGCRVVAAATAASPDPACGAAGPVPEGMSVDPDRLIFAMQAAGLIRGALFLHGTRGADPAAGALHLVVAFAAGVAGYARLVHGGFAAAALDEAAGGLVFELKHSGALGPPASRAFTARLEVDCCAPLPTTETAVATTRLLGIEAGGRKAAVAAEMRDAPGGRLFAESRALFVKPRDDLFAAGGEAAAQRSQL
jgi:acyl-coenzyme A thioesterase PaaI-like protein